MFKVCALKLRKAGAYQCSLMAVSPDTAHVCCRFSDLFALAEEAESKSKRKSSKKKIKMEEGNSDTEASEVSVSIRRVFHNVHDSVI